MLSQGSTRMSQVCWYRGSWPHSCGFPIYIHLGLQQVTRDNKQGLLFPTPGEKHGFVANIFSFFTFAFVVGYKHEP